MTREALRDLLLIIAFIALCFVLLWVFSGDVKFPDPLRSIWNDLGG
jgi:hypothetical protein